MGKHAKQLKFKAEIPGLGGWSPTERWSTNELSWVLERCFVDDFTWSYHYLVDILNNLQFNINIGYHSWLQWNTYTYMIIYDYILKYIQFGWYVDIVRSASYQGLSTHLQYIFIYVFLDITASYISIDLLSRLIYVYIATAVYYTSINLHLSLT